MRGKKIVYGVGGFSIALLLSFLLPHFVSLPTPLTLLGMAMELRPPSQSYRFFDSSPIAASERPLLLIERPRYFAPPLTWRDGTVVGFDQFWELTDTNALLVLHRGELVYENYPHGANRATVFPSFSLSKSIVSDLLGIALSEGKITALSDPIGKYLPTLPADYASLKVDDLLNMRSGIQVSEKYDSVFSKIAYMYVTTDLTKFVGNLHFIPITHTGKFEYRSVDYLLLGQVLSSATGESLSHYLQEKIWRPMGAEYTASWSIDSDDNRIEKGFCCLNARAIDFVKFGLLHLKYGRLNERQILPIEWAQRPLKSAPANQYFDYGNGWWLPRMAGTQRDYLAIGIHGQFVYIDPASETVIVKLSDHGAEQDEALTVAAFREIVASLSNAISPGNSPIFK